MICKDSMCATDTKRTTYLFGCVPVYLQTSHFSKRVAHDSNGVRRDPIVMCNEISSRN